MTALIVFLSAFAGAGVGSFATVRFLPHVVARMSPAERVTFARKVTKLADIREVT